MTDSKHTWELTSILKEYFRNSNESLAVDLRKYFANTDNSLLDVKPNEEKTNQEQNSNSLEVIASETNHALSETLLEDWFDNQNVMQALHVSTRTLQTLRSNGTLAFSRIGNKLYYRHQDILKILSDNYTMRKIQNYGRDK